MYCQLLEYTRICEFNNISKSLYLELSKENDTRTIVQVRDVAHGSLVMYTMHFNSKENCFVKFLNLETNNTLRTVHMHTRTMGIYKSNIQNVHKVEDRILLGIKSNTQCTAS